MGTAQPTDRDTVSSGPRYENPPVIESALGIQFSEPIGFNSATFGLYYTTIRDRFPIVDEQARLLTITETFPKRLVVPHVKLSAVPVPPQRMWFKDSQEGRRLIQLQADRFVFNWRKHAGEPYTSYFDNVAICLSEFKGFVRVCTDLGLPAICPNLCEVTYVNRIEPAESESPIELFSKLFTGLNLREYATPFLQSPDAVRLDRVYVIGEQEGRLYAEATIGADPEEKREFVALKLTGRVVIPQKEPNAALAGVRAALNKAHEWVVSGFESLTDPGIQRERWRKVR